MSFLSSSAVHGPFFNPTLSQHGCLPILTHPTKTPILNIQLLVNSGWAHREKERERERERWREWKRDNEKTGLLEILRYQSSLCTSLPTYIKQAPPDGLSALYFFILFVIIIILVYS